MPTCYSYDPETGKGCLNYGTKTTECLKCKNGCDSTREDSHQGQTFVALHMVPESEIQDTQPTDARDDMQGCLEFIRHAMRMDPLSREILFQRVLGLSLRRIGMKIERDFRRHITVQAIHLRIRKITRTCPMAETLLMTVKKAKRKVRT